MGNHEFCEDCGASNFHLGEECDPERKAAYERSQSPKPVVTKIWKYVLSEMRNIIMVPYRAKLLTAQAQGESVVIWMDVGDSMFMEERTFVLRETGNEFTHGPNATYIGTVQLRNGSYVVHVYEEKP